MSRNRFEPLDINAETFESFYQKWLFRQDRYLQKLQQAVQGIRNPNIGNGNEEVRCKKLIARVIAHYERYYSAKSKATRDDVFLVLSPTWLTPFERSFLWIGGFEPGLLFQLVTNHVWDLSVEQWGRLEQLAGETGEEERELEAAMAGVKERLTSPVVVEAARKAVNGEVDHVELAVARLRTAMEEVVECADYLRVKTVAKVTEVLSTAQTVAFLAAFGQFLQTIRIWGTERDDDTWQ